MEILESQIEDILVSSPALLQSILNLKDEPSLLTRQMMIPSGRLDLLFAYQTRLLLVELKVIAFRQEFIRQILNYKSDLTTYQTNGKLLRGEIQPYLLCTSASETQRETAATKGIICFDYNPEEVLHYFYQNLRPIAFFAEIKPIDIGIWNLHLVHDFIYFLEKVNSVDQLRSLVKGSSKTLYNKIKFANELRLIEWLPNQDLIKLSKLGSEYVKQKDSHLPSRLSEEQIGILRKFVIQNPFESSIILGVASIVEATFALAKNTYPVPMSWLIEYFSYYAGKYFDWQTKKAKYNATRMYSNYAVDLGLLAKSGESIYITPDGFRFTIQLQLHKSLKMLEAM
ncbi:MAG: hypothetical protein L0Y68_02480 [Candidatus Dadabacteria bacterium]|nr:hypothetical protein [Candidatus Dadabacteria bacterium]